MSILYVYAIGEGLTSAPLRNTEAVDGSANFSVAEEGGLSAIYTPVDAEEFSQEAIDRRTADMGWLGDIGFRHQNVITVLSRESSAIPLRAFTLFSSEGALRRYLEQEAASLREILGDIRDRQEWTLRLEFDPEEWSRALVRLVPELQQIQAETEKAGAGKGYLLRKKLEEERKIAARTAEEDIVRQVEETFSKRFSAPAIVENREAMRGSFPQINLLVRKDQARELLKTHQEVAKRYAGDGVRVVLTGPWPPYTFTAGKSRG